MALSQLMSLFHLSLLPSQKENSTKIVLITLVEADLRINKKPRISMIWWWGHLEKYKKL